MENSHIFMRRLLSLFCAGYLVYLFFLFFEVQFLFNVNTFGLFPAPKPFSRVDIPGIGYDENVPRAKKLIYPQYPISEVSIPDLFDKVGLWARSRLTAGVLLVKYKRYHSSLEGGESDEFLRRLLCEFYPSSVRQERPGWVFIEFNDGARVKFQC